MIRSGAGELASGSTVQRRRGVAGGLSLCPFRSPSPPALRRLSISLSLSHLFLVKRVKKGMVVRSRHVVSIFVDKVDRKAVSQDDDGECCLRELAGKVGDPWYILYQRDGFVRPGGLLLINYFFLFKIQPAKGRLLSHRHEKQSAPPRHMSNQRASISRVNSI